MSTSQEFYLIYVDNDRLLSLNCRVYETFQWRTVLVLPWFLGPQSPLRVGELGGDEARRRDGCLVGLLLAEYAH